MSSQTHILIVTPGFPESMSQTDILTYLQKYLLYILDFHQNIKFTIISIHYPFQKKLYKWHGIDVHCIGGRNRNFPFFYKFWKQCTTLFEKINAIQKVDLVHSLWLREAAFFGYSLEHRYKVPHVNTVMGTELMVKNYFLNYLGRKKLTLVSPSSAQASMIAKKFPDSSSTIIPWGIEKGKAVYDEFREIDILGVGNFSDNKNYIAFIQIIAQLKEEIKNINVVIIGDGVGRLNLIEEIKKYNLEENVQLLGQLSNEKVLDKMLKSKVLFHTSNYESFGYVFIEALACGMSIVSKRVGIAKESPRWKLFSSQKQAVSNLKSLLVQQEDYSATYPFPIYKTAKQYLQLYSQKIDTKESYA